LVAETKEPNALNVLTITGENYDCGTEFYGGMNGLWPRFLTFSGPWTPLKYKI